MKILNLIQEYLDEHGYPSNRHLCYGGYSGFYVEWIADNGAYCRMDGQSLLNKMIDSELRRGE